jgi:hypothetical protein
LIFCNIDCSKQFTWFPKDRGNMKEKTSKWPQKNWRKNWRCRRRDAWRCCIEFALTISASHLCFLFLSFADLFGQVTKLARFSEASSIQRNILREATKASVSDNDNSILAHATDLVAWPFSFQIINFWLFYSAFRLSIVSAVIIFQLLQLVEPTLNLGTFLQPLNLNKQTQNFHLLQLQDTCDASQNVFWFYFIRVATENLAFCYPCHKLQISYIYVIVVKCLENFLA